MRKTFTPNQKATIAKAVLKGDKSIAKIASAHEVHPTQVNQWANMAKEGLPRLFIDKRKNGHKELEDKIEHLYKIIGQRELELDWLKKNAH